MLNHTAKNVNCQIIALKSLKMGQHPNTVEMPSCELQIADVKAQKTVSIST